MHCTGAMCFEHAQGYLLQVVAEYSHSRANERATQPPQFVGGSQHEWKTLLVSNQPISAAAASACYGLSFEAYGE